jgi:hypothetical protein
MKHPEELVQHCRRRWWWSPRPFWEYIDQGGRGWAKFVNIHPGMFNMAWQLSGASTPPADFSEYANTTAWVYTQGLRAMSGGTSLPDMALSLPQAEMLRRLHADLPRGALNPAALEYVRLHQWILESRGHA